jgi:hypothetical protein
MLKNNSLFYDTNNELVSKYLKENEKILPVRYIKKKFHFGMSLCYILEGQA